MTDQGEFILKAIPPDESVDAQEREICEAARNAECPPAAKADYDQLVAAMFEGSIPSDELALSIVTAAGKTMQQLGQDVVDAQAKIGALRFGRQQPKPHSETTGRLDT